MYEWISKKTNKTDRNMTLLLFAGGAALIAVTSLVPGVPGKWVFQLIALGLLTAAIFFVTRYQSKLFFYRIIEDGEGSFDLTVTETNIKGKRAVTVCRVGLLGIRTVRMLDFADGGESLEFWSSVKKTKTKIHDYTVDLRPVKSILVMVHEGGDDLWLRFSPEEEFYQLLKKWEKNEPV